ncbi:PDR/VanB family oxidoreductase [Nitrospirillum iridis]|uniref:Vanillate O-demethylase ferredoxin subunit n=1 Tax=Nitrospirillum iridis TaxID=765888 RepID=A0A7X0B504_9PROT|nr:PDR/VanB family oxidoreductase [Nitrospirillum iridis]MBB6255101.1 vanillate O-demethylase ferredoxin subunit [Nitrospirillum iridis]
MRFKAEWGPARLLATRDVADGVRQFDILPEGAAPAHGPGSHIQVQVLIQGQPDVRHYSLVGEAGDGVLRIAVKRLPDSRGGSAYMWGLEPGARLMVSAPLNHFELSVGRPDYLLIAGGIGITPISSMARALARRGAPFRLLYAARRAADLAYAEELGAVLGDRLTLFVDADGRFIDFPAELARVAPGGEVYICGPAPMMAAARRAWEALGRPPADFRLETFGAGGGQPAQPFVARVPRLDVEVTVRADQTLLSALREAGADLMYDCQRGECGLCALDVLDVAGGCLDHRDVFLSERQKAEGRQMCVCVSRATGTVTLDTGHRPG